MAAKVLLICLGIAVLLIAVAVWRHIFKNIYSIHAATPKSERDWLVVALAAAMVVFGALVGIGAGPEDLPLAPALHEFFHWSDGKK